MQTKHNHPDAVISEEISPEPGRMMEYGWYDKDVEDGVLKYRMELGLTREMAIVHLFNTI